MPFTGEVFSLNEIKKNTFNLIGELNKESSNKGSEHFIPLEQLEKALDQFFNIGEKIEIEPTLLNTEDSDFGNISELGDYGLQLLTGLEQWAEFKKLENRNVIQIMILSLAVWIHDQSGTLQQLENIVNALSQIANQTSETKALIKLHKVVDKITNSAHEVIKSDLDKSDPGRAWRILNLNHGIIATRTHNIDIMNSVFEQLLTRLPEDAASFFADGMKQMDIIGYPDHVKNVMEQFYQLTNNPTLH